MMAEENLKLSSADPTNWAAGPQRIMASAETTAAARMLHDYIRDSAHRTNSGRLLVEGEELAGYGWYQKTHAAAAFDYHAQVMDRLL